MWALAQRPSDDDYAYLFFDLFAKGHVRIQTLIVHTYFLESSDLYK